MVASTSRLSVAEPEEHNVKNSPYLDTRDLKGKGSALKGKSRQSMEKAYDSFGNTDDEFEEREMNSKVGKLPHIVIDKLSTENSRYWFHTMEQHLKFLDVWNMIVKYQEKGQFVYQTILRTRHRLQAKDLKARMIMEQGLKNTDVLNAKQFTYAGGVWSYIPRKCLNKSEAEVVQMYMRVLQWKKNPSMSIADSLDEIEQFNFEIEDVAGLGKSFNPTMILIIFLNGLGSEWSDVISSIETSKNYNRNDILL